MIKKAPNTVVTLGKSVFDKEEEIKRLNYRVLELSSIISDKDETIIELKKCNLEILHRELELKNTVKQQTKEIEQYRESCSKLGSELELYGKDKSVIQEKMQEFTSTIKTLQEELDLKCRRIESIDGENKKYRAEVKDSERVKSNLEEELILTHKSLDKAQEKIRSLESIIKQKDHYIEMLLKKVDKNSSSVKSQSIGANSIGLSCPSIEHAKIPKSDIIASLKLELDTKDRAIRTLEKENNNLFVRLKNKK